MRNVNYIDVELALRKFVAPEIVFGIGARRLAAQYAKNYGARQVLLVTDGGLTEAGWAGQVAGVLEEARIRFSVWARVSPNPRVEEIMAGAEFYEKESCDALVAVGGGSVVDCAKGIGMVTSNHRHILTFEGIDRVDAPMPPLICVPTTAGASADVSQFAIITDLSQKTKIAIVSKSLVPDVSLIDPETLTTMSPYLAACTGMDALTHAIEGFVSNAHSSLTDIHALQAIELIVPNLVVSVRNPDDFMTRARVNLGSLQAGLAFSNASLGAVHAMSHSLGGLLDLPHGECNSLLLDQVMAFNYSAAKGRYARVGQAMGLDLHSMSEREIIAALRAAIVELRTAAGIHGTLSARGVRRNDLDDLARLASRDVCLVTNPRKADRRDIEVIYAEAL